MSDQTPNDSLIRTIASAVETMREQMATKHDLEGMATKHDLEGMATKHDLEGMATKRDLESLGEQVSYMGGQVETMRDQMATKEDLAVLRDQVDYMGGQLEAVREQVATKGDIARLEAKIEVETTVVRGDIEQVQLRLDAIERALTARLGQLETEMSRLRSVVYLLVKDKPEMLRLLGQTPPAGGASQP